MCHFCEDVWNLPPVWFHTAGRWAGCTLSLGSRGRCFFTTLEEAGAAGTAAGVVVAGALGTVVTGAGGLMAGADVSLGLGEGETLSVDGEADTLAGAGALPGRKNKQICGKPPKLVVKQNAESVISTFGFPTRLVFRCGDGR